MQEGSHILKPTKNIKIACILSKLVKLDSSPNSFDKIGSFPNFLFSIVIM